MLELAILADDGTLAEGFDAGCVATQGTQQALAHGGGERGERFGRLHDVLFVPAGEWVVDDGGDGGAAKRPGQDAGRPRGRCPPG